MAFPDLPQGEEVKLHHHSHWKILIPPFLLAIVGTVAIALALSFMGKLGLPDQIDHYVRMALWILLAVLWVVQAAWPVLQWQCTHFVVTNKKIMTQSGIIQRDSTSIMLSNVVSVDQEINYNDRLFRCGTLNINTAAGAGSEGGVIIFRDIPRVAEAARVIDSLRT